MLDEALLLEFGEDGEGCGDGAFGWAFEAAYSEVDDVELVEAEVAEVVVDAVDDLLTGECGDPGCVCAAASTDFGDDDEAVRVGMERLFDDLVGDVRAVEVAGVDVIDA